MLSACYHLKYTSYHLKYTSYHLKYTCYHLKYTSYHLKYTSYHLKYTSYHLKYTCYHLKYRTLGPKIQVILNMLSPEIMTHDSKYRWSCLHSILLWFSFLSLSRYYCPRVRTSSTLLALLVCCQGLGIDEIFWVLWRLRVLKKKKWFPKRNYGDVPVTITVRIAACLSCRIIGVVSGLSRFSMTSKPRNVRLFSTWSLQHRAFTNTQRSLSMKLIIR